MESPSEATLHRLRRGTTQLNAVESGRGKQTLVFVHGLGGSHRFFGRQMSYFADRYRVVAVDLRGHGDSDGLAPEEPIRGFASDVAWQCEQLNVNRPVIVGHSGGGHVAAQLAADFSDLASALVFLDSSLIFPADRLDDMEDLVDRFHRPDFKAVVRTFAEGYFAGSDDADLRDEVAREMSSIAQPVLTAFARDLLDWRADEVLPACDLPALYIGARHHPEFDDLRMMCPTLVYGQTVGSGHFMQLEVPDQVNAMIKRFLTICGFG